MTTAEKKYRMSSLVGKYYQRWIKRPTLFGVGGDVECFYQFVKACISYSGRHRKDGQWLKYFLQKDMCEKMTQNEISKAVILFDHLLDCHYTGFPNPFVEMRDPYWVRSRLERSINLDGSPTYSKKYIDDFLTAHFGENWENAYRMKKGLSPKPDNQR